MAHIHCSICTSPAEQSYVSRVALGTKTDPLLEEIGKKVNPESDFSIYQLCTREWLFLLSDLSDAASSSSAFPCSLVLVKRQEKEELCIILDVPFSQRRAVCSCAVEDNVPR